MAADHLPPSFKDIVERLNAATSRDLELVTLVNELKADLNALRADFRAHDHGATYTAATNRINGAPNAVSGTETNTAVAAADLASVEATYPPLRVPPRD